jgi:hypothetical protein
MLDLEALRKISDTPVDSPIGLINLPTNLPIISIIATLNPPAINILNLLLHRLLQVARPPRLNRLHNPKLGIISNAAIIGEEG